MKLIIKEVRERMKLTQDEVSTLSGIKKRTYVDYENCKADIPLSKLQNIATALNVELFELLISNDGLKNKLSEPPAVYQLEKSNEVLAQKKTIEILESVVEDLRDDKRLLKNIIENNQGNAKLG